MIVNNLAEVSGVLAFGDDLHRYSNSATGSARIRAVLHSRSFGELLEFRDATKKRFSPFSVASGCSEGCPQELRSVDFYTRRVVNDRRTAEGYPSPPEKIRLPRAPDNFGGGVGGLCMFSIRSGQPSACDRYRFHRLAAVQVRQKRGLGRLQAPPPPAAIGFRF